MHGFNQGELCVANNIENYDIWCVQEHWLYQNSSSTINNFRNNVEICGISSVEDNRFVDKGLLYGGLVFLWNNNLKLISSI